MDGEGQRRAPPPSAPGRALPQASTPVVVEEYARLLSPSVTRELLERLGLEGQLRASKIRSIVWRIFLKCLPVDKTEWTLVLERTRLEYTKLRKEFLLDPRTAASQQDPNINNPLSLQEQSPWQQYFADSELRDLIQKDVDRTFPEMEFFQEERIRTIMRNILFVYAKENPYVSYKQGMHEILAPLLFVIFCDVQAFSQLSDQVLLLKLSKEEVAALRILLQERFLEHDAYAMLKEVLLFLGAWYECGDEAASPSSSQAAAPRSRHPSDVPEPFSRVQDQVPTSQLMQRLRFIGDVVLKEVDSQLQAHLSALDIPAQLYGIRWLRLLFGREFPMHDLLFLWDAIFADRPVLQLVDFIFVAMLVQIRNLLLESDYSGCLQYLMRYPPVVDVHYLVNLARHYRSPKKVARPKINGATNYAHMTPSALPDMAVLEHESELLKEQVACLQSRLNDMDLLARASAKQLRLVLEETANEEGPSWQALRERLTEIAANLSRSAVVDVDHVPQITLKERSLGNSPRKPLRGDNELVELDLKPVAK